MTRSERLPRAIVFVHPSDELYGSDRCLLDLVRRLPPHYRAVVVLPVDVRYAGQLRRELTAAGAAVHHVDYAVLRRMWLTPRRLPRLLWRALAGSVRLARLIRREHAALVYVNTLAPVGGPLAAKLARRRCVWHVHEVLDDEPGSIRTALRWLLSLCAAHIIANSGATARAVVAGNRRRAARTTVVYPGIAPLPDPPERAPGDGRPLRLALVGRLAPRKGVEEGLTAAGIARVRGVDLMVDVLGSPPPGRVELLEALRRQAERAGIGSVTMFHGFVEDVPERLREIDVLVVPSQRPEPFGIVILEGMAAGCAVVATRNGGGSDEILEDGVTGCYCATDPGAIATAVERLARNEELRRSVGRNAVAAVRERFTTERYARDVVQVLERVISGRQRVNGGGGSRDSSTGRVTDE